MHFMSLIMWFLASPLNFLLKCLALDEIAWIHMSVGVESHIRGLNFSSLPFARSTATFYHTLFPLSVCWSTNLLLNLQPLIARQTHLSQGGRQSRVVDNLSIDGRRTRCIIFCANSNSYIRRNKLSPSCFWLCHHFFLPNRRSETPKWR